MISLASIWLLKEYICFDYNFAVLLITLIVIYKEISNYYKSNILIKFDFKKDLIIGIIAGTAILFKQTTGIILSIAVIGYKILNVSNKKEVKEFIKILFTRLLGVLIPVIILFIYLILTGALNSFIDYCILGVKTFSNHIPYTKLLNSEEILIKIFSILVPISLMLMPIISFIKKDEKLLIIWVFSMAGIVVAFPISDNIHFLIGSIPALIGVIYLLYKIVIYVLEKINKEKLTLYLKYFLVAFSYLILAIFVIKAIKINANYIKNINNENQIKHFKYIPTSENLSQKINALDKYILNQEKNVYILDAEAAIYMMPIDKYNKDYDMFLKGNLGSQGEQGQIEKIKKSENSIYLIKNEETSRNWQNPELVRNFIKENLNKVGQIVYFDVYEK